MNEQPQSAPASPPETLASEPISPENRPATPAGASSARATGLAISALLLAVLALLATTALFLRGDTKREITDFRVQSLIQDHAAAISQMRQLLADQRADQRAARDQLALRLEQFQTRLEAQQERLSALATADRSDWQLAEAEYFLQLANQRLLLGGDPRTALEQLVAADDIIRHVQDSGLLPARAALAKDIAALKALELVDTEGLYLALEAVAEQAQELHLIDPVTVQQHEPDQPDAAASLGERFQYGLRAALRKLDDLVQIRRRDEPYKPLLAPQYEAALQQSNQKLYEHSLNKARQALVTYYTVDEHATQIVAEAIAELSAKQVSMKLPDISQSRRELKAYLNARRVAAQDALPKVDQ